MKQSVSFAVLALLCLQTLGQVAIGTLSPSSAAVLHLEALNLKTLNYGGFLMPVVTEAQQASIPVSTADASDDGLMVYVSDPITGKHCWDIYDGVQHQWRSISCQTVASCSDILYEEDFNSYAENSGVTGASSANGDYPASVTKWTLTSFDSFGSTTPALPGTLVDASDYGLVTGGALEMRDTNGVFQFETTTIDITGYTDIVIGFDVSGRGDFEYDTTAHSGDYNCGFDNSDYLDIEYSIDGGAFIEVPSFSLVGTPNHTFVFDETFASDGSLVNFSTTLTGLTGTDLVIRIRAQNWAGSEYILVDNIVVRCN
ncbi:hypothetical protein [Gilvibacter sp.]|uniref:hypothetical protein n=1 Tax=Gilvibacter sp. TaxID=2729997 RepID=UPI0035BE7921